MGVRPFSRLSRRGSDAVAAGWLQNPKRDTFVESQVSKSARPGAHPDFSLSALKIARVILAPEMSATRPRELGHPRRRRIPYGFDVKRSRPLSTSQWLHFMKPLLRSR